MQTKIEILSKVNLFAGIKDNPSALEAISAIMTEKDYVVGDKLIVEGALGDEFFILLEGQVSIYRKTPDGDTYKVLILKGESHPALGEGGLVEAEPRSATVVCDKPCKCLVLTRDAFAKFSEEHPKWSLPIFKKISLMLMARLKQTSTDLMLLHKALMNEIRGS